MVTCHSGRRYRHRDDGPAISGSHGRNGDQRRSDNSKLWHERNDYNDCQLFDDDDDERVVAQPHC
jgi:hypothetical protein